MGPRRPASRLRLRALSQRCPFADRGAPRRRRPHARGEGHARADAARHPGARELHRRAPRHAHGQGALRGRRAVRLPGGLRARASVAQPGRPRGVERQEEAQGQGVRAGREPGGRDAGSGGDRRAARRAHRLRAARAPAARAGRWDWESSDRRRTGQRRAVDRLRDQPRRGRPARSRQRRTRAHRRPRSLRGDARRHRPGHPLDPLRELHHPERRSRLALRRSAHRASPRRRAASACSTTRSARRTPGGSTGARSARPASSVRAFHPIQPLDLVANFVPRPPQARRGRRRRAR